MTSVPEYCFDIKFTVYEEIDDDISIFPVFEDPTIITCDEILQDPLRFLYSNLDDYICECDMEILAYEIVSYHEQAIQLVETTTDDDILLIPLEISFGVARCFNKYILQWYDFESFHDQSEDLDQSEESTQINQAIEQSMEQLSFVPTSQEALE